MFPPDASCRFISLGQVPISYAPVSMTKCPAGLIIILSFPSILELSPFFIVRINKQEAEVSLLIKSLLLYCKNGTASVVSKYSNAAKSPSIAPLSKWIRDDLYRTPFIASLRKLFFKYKSPEIETS